MKRTILATIIAIMFTASCTDRQPVNDHMITVSIEPLRFLTEQIAGNGYTVQTMVPEGISPETYEPTTRQMANLSQSALFIKVGEIGFERTWGDRMKANAPGTKFISASDGIKPEKTASGNDDPHTWMSARNAKQMARNICRALTALSPKDSKAFSQRTAALCQKIDSTDNEVRSIISKSKSKTFLIYHPILTYFAAEYGLTQIPIEEEGREPSAAQTQTTINEARKSGVKVIFVQKQFSDRTAEAVAKAVGARKENINPLSHDWCAEMVGIAEKLK